MEQFDRGGSDAISSMAKTLLTSFPGHEPIALLNPMLKNHTRFDAVLDLLDQAGLPFILDVYVPPTHICVHATYLHVQVITPPPSCTLFSPAGAGRWLPHRISRPS